MTARRAAFALLYAAGRTLDVGGALVHYLAAGTLSLADLRAAVADRWRAFGEVESERYRDSGLMDWERRLYLSALKPGERVLVVGCGTGRDVIALLRAGFRVDGIDIAPACVDLARRAVASRGLTAWLAAGTLEGVVLPDRYDAVIFSWYCYSYIPGTLDRVRTLRCARAALADGGRILISYVTSDGSRRGRLIALTRAVARLTRSDWRPEPGDVVLLSARGSRVHYEHRFAGDELEAEARTAGLRVTGHELTEDGLAVLAV
jgi:SAM-dependent methyltransferase